MLANNALKHYFLIIQYRLRLSTGMNKNRKDLSKFFRVQMACQTNMTNWQAGTRPDFLSGESAYTIWCSMYRYIPINKTLYIQKNILIHRPFYKIQNKKCNGTKCKRPQHYKKRSIKFHSLLFLLFNSKHIIARIIISTLRSHSTSRYGCP